MLRLDSATKLKWETSPTGLLTAFITLGVADKQLEYYQPKLDGTGFERTVETITLDELRRDESVASARGLPIDLGHPKSGKHNQNAEGLLIGSTLQEAMFDGNDFVLAATFQDQRADRLIKEALERNDGLFPEISPGYSIERLQRTDSIGYQIGRIYDHAALLLPGEGRGAQDVRVRLDASDRIAADLVAESSVRNFYFVDSKKKKPMPIISIGKRVYNLDDASDLVALKPAVEKLAEDLEAAETLATNTEARAAQIKTELEEATLRAEARADAAQKEAEAAKGRADALDLKVKEVESTRLDSDTLAADRKDAIETWALCLPVLRADSADFEPDYSLAPAEIKRAYLAKKYPDIDLSTASDERVDGMWEVAKPTRNDSTGTKPVDVFANVVSFQAAETVRSDMNAAAKKKADRAKRIAENGAKSMMGVKY
jgi:hypothetical protein